MRGWGKYSRNKTKSFLCLQSYNYLFRCCLPRLGQSRVEEQGRLFSTEKMRVGLTLDSRNHEPSHSQGWRPGVSLAITALFDNYANEEHDTFQITLKLF